MYRLKAIINLIRNNIDGFVLSLLFVIGLAYIFPELGTSTSPLSLKGISQYGVAVVFGFYGLRLNKDRLRSSLGNWKLHLLVQGTTFLFFPLMAYAVYNIFATDADIMLWLGILFLASLPSTVSSSVVMVGIGGGNVAGAIFNASISGLLGLILTPMWIAFFINNIQGVSEVEKADMSDLALKLFFQVVLPVIIGMLIQPKLGKWAENNRNITKKIDQSVILMIVYTSFAGSFIQGDFSQLGIREFGFVFIAVVLSFVIGYWFVGKVADRLGFSVEEKITALFCGSNKSLVHGTSMARVIFPNLSQGGLILLPIMMYHITQVVVISFLAQRYGKRKL